MDSTKVIQLKEKLIMQAVREYSTIYPSGSNAQLTDCFTIYKNRLLFWFNCEKSTTHMLAADL